MTRVLLGSVLVMSTAFASAHNCPNVMTEIDSMLQRPAGKTISADKMAKIRELRAEGERLHKEGKHDESLKVLGEAKRLLGN